MIGFVDRYYFGAGLLGSKGMRCQDEFWVGVRPTIERREPDTYQLLMGCANSRRVTKTSISAFHSFPVVA